MTQPGSSKSSSWEFWFGFLFTIPVIDYFFLQILPYDFFQLLRLIGCGGFIFLAYLHFDLDSDDGMARLWVLGGLAAVYNPIFKLEMTREIWVLINICTALTVYALAFGLIFPKNKISASNKSNSVNYSEKVDITDEKQNLKSDAGSPSEELDEFEVDEEIGSIVDKLNEPPDDLYARHLKLYLAKALGIKPSKRFPNGFLSDAYISGFSTGYFAVVLDIVLNGINWPKERKGSQAIKFFKTLGPRDDNLALKLLEDKTVAAKLTLNETFIEGRDHGNLLAVSYYEKLRHDLSEPLIDACRNLANSTNLSMPDAVFALTLQKYVVSKWPIETPKETNKKNALTDEHLKSALKDFAARMQSVDKDSLFALLLEVVRELNQLFEISPDAKSWFSDLDTKHIEDLQNLQAATWFRRPVTF